MPHSVSAGDERWFRRLADLAGRIREGRCTLLFPDSRCLHVDGGRPSEASAILEFRRARAVRRLLLGGSVGFAEGYIDEDWDTPDLVAVIELALRNEAALGTEVRGHRLVRLLHRLWHLANANTRRGSRRNIASHYDLSNAFYALWLDDELTYSSALFADAHEKLADAQERKYRQLSALLDARPGQHILEIGCGWGGLAVRAARELDCRVTALTLSERQAEFARARIRAEGVQDRVDVRLQDYRDIEGTYDRIASIEMFEAVGEAYWPTYFRRFEALLKPGGVGAMQVITIEDRRFPVYRRGADFIQRYIFPGGMLPSPTVLDSQIAAAGLRRTERITFGPSYALTLARWRERFRAAWPRIRALGFDERFRRTWDYYLAYCEAGFRAGAIDVCQIRIEKPTASVGQ